MDISKLKRQFIREARSSPKKVAVLALVTGIGVWRLAPLVSGLFSAESNDTPMMAAQTQPAMPASQGLPPNTSSAARPSWRELAGRIGADPLMQSAEIEAGRNPFGGLAPPSGPSEETAAAGDAPRELSAAGLVLSSTVVGAARRTALINGRIYGEGDHLTMPGDAIAVVSIRPRSVLLERNGDQLELTIAQRDPTEKIQLRREQ